MRIEIVTECEHGEVRRHQSKPPTWSGWQQTKMATPPEWCLGGSRRVVDGPTDEMVEAAAYEIAIAVQQGYTWQIAGRAALDAAWMVLTGQPPTSTEMEMGPYKPAFGYTEPAELKDDRP